MSSLSIGSGVAVEKGVVKEDAADRGTKSPIPLLFCTFVKKLSKKIL
jgi:hypothetical protein